MQNTPAHLSEYSSAYIDDILIFSKNWADHLYHIEAVLLVLRKAGLTANPDKCVWGAKSLEYLRHKIGYGMVGVPEALVKALKDYIRPTGHIWVWPVTTGSLYQNFLSGRVPYSGAPSLFLCMG